MIPATLSAAEVGALVDIAGATVRRMVNVRRNTPDHIDHLRVGGRVRFTERQAEAFVESFRVARADAVADDIDPLATQTSRSKSRS